MNNRIIPRQRHGFLILLLIILVCSCQKGIIYHSYQPISTIGWSKSDSIFFKLNPIQRNITCKLDINIRHFESYPYQDIWISLKHNLEDSTTYKIDTIHIYLIEDTGDWSGKGTGNLKQYTTHIKDLTLTDKAGKDLIISHIMQDSILSSISDIGICLKNTP